MHLFKKVCVLLVVAVVALPVLVKAGMSDDYYRTDKMDLYLKYEYMKAKQLNYNGPTGPVPITLDYTNLMGIGFSQHFPEGLEGRFETLWGSSTLRFKDQFNSLSSYTFINTGTLNVDWNILKKALTPFISGGFGWQYLEAQGRDGIYVPGYWDPWYGYIPGYYTYPVYYETDFMWNAGFGLRLDMGSWFIKFFGEVSWVYYRNIPQPQNMPKWGLAMGGSF
jgi:hypothetical protein